jgi:hypothetical protein
LQPVPLEDREDRCGVHDLTEPEPVAVHVFGEVEPASLRLAGWTPDCARTEPHTCGAEPEERP